MLVPGFIFQSCSHRNHSPVRTAVRTVAARAIWSRFASPRAELTASPSLSRPNLFAGD